MNSTAKPILSLFLILSGVLHGQVYINEVSAAQNAGVVDEDGDYPDWIELYNAGGTTVDLQGYTMRMRDNNLVDWTFPSIEIPANDHLIVFASEKNRKVVIDHWELPIYSEMLWRYYSLLPAPPSI